MREDILPNKKKEKIIDLFVQIRSFSVNRTHLLSLFNVYDYLENTYFLALNLSVFVSYYARYYEGGVSSVYLWDLDHGFAGVILIKKAGDGSKKIKGCWDSIHVVEVAVNR